MLNNFDASQGFNQLPTDVMAIKTMLSHFKYQNFSIDLKSCQERLCENNSIYKTEFQDGADRVRQLIQAYDNDRADIFASNDDQDRRFQKLLILLGDQYRQAVRYPMDYKTTETATFLKSLFADHAVYNFRLINPAQPDMGNFSRSNFSHIAPINKTVMLTSKKEFRAAGVYALPGQTFKVTRVDQANVTTSIFINTMRSGSTHLFGDDGYVRPKYLKTTWIDLKSGETIALTSPYGGPIQIGFDASDLAVEFTFENVGEHPFWKGEADNVSFAQKLAAGIYDWAEVSTPSFEIHTTLTKMRKTLQHPDWNTVSLLANATVRYMYNFPSVVTGLQGPGIDVVPEIHNFANDHQWTIDKFDGVRVVQHVNADQANCGYGCSGNPYDSYAEFSPVSGIDQHEMGHNIDNGRLQFNGWGGHSSNFLSAIYNTSKFNYNGSDYSKADQACPSYLVGAPLPFKKLFDLLQSAQQKADPAEYLAYMKAANIHDYNDPHALYLQMLMSAQAHGALTNGWNLLARLYVMDREFNRAKKDDATWMAKRDSLGFGDYTLVEIKAIDHNDWLVNAISYLTGRDYRDYLKMWGIEFSNKADAQAASFNYPVIARKYYVSHGTDYCGGLNKQEIAIDGTTAWPSP